MNYTVGMLESVKTIFAGILVGALRADNANKQLIIKSSRMNFSRFQGYFTRNIFKDEYAVFYEIVVTANMRHISLAQLDSVIDNNRDLILDSPYVDISGYRSLSDGRPVSDDEVIEAFKETLKEALVELSNTYVDEEDYITSCNVFIDNFKTAYLKEVSVNMAAMLGEMGVDIKKPGRRTRHYQGYDDAQEYYREASTLLSELESSGNGGSYVLDDKWLKKELEEDDKVNNDAILNFGIHEIDDSIGDMLRGYMVGILGPTKGGKTRMSNYLVQRALAKGLNVCVWPLEGSSEEWEANQVACRIASLSAETSTQDKINRLDSKKIQLRKYNDDPDIRKEIASAKTWLATSPECGRLSFMNDVGYCEDFLDKLKDHYENTNPFDVLVIDSLVNILSKTGKDKSKRISEAYMSLKVAIKKEFRKPVLAIMPAQLKQDVIDFLRKNPNETIDVTAGGESAETIRTPDEVIGLFSSKEEREGNIMKIYHVASRHSKNFRDFSARCFLECCYFGSME